VVVVGEVLSRSTLPHVYTPMDIDFAVTKPVAPTTYNGCVERDWISPLGHQKRSHELDRPMTCDDSGLALRT